MSFPLLVTKRWKPLFGINLIKNITKLYDHYLNHYFNYKKLYTVSPSNNPDSSTYTPDLIIYDQGKYSNWQTVIQGNSTKAKLIALKIDK